ncbi:MAG: hypothetical protein R3Y54_12445 [Eubacteriales bacterium]
MAVMNVVLPCTVLFALPVGVYMYQNGNVSLETFILTMLLNLSLSAPLIKLMLFLPVFPQLDFAIKKIHETFDATSLKTGTFESNPKSFDITFKM